MRREPIKENWLSGFNGIWDAQAICDYKNFMKLNNKQTVVI